MNADKRAYKTVGNRGLFDMEENKAIKAGHSDGLWASEEEKNTREG